MEGLCELILSKSSALHDIQVRDALPERPDLRIGSNDPFSSCPIDAKRADQRPDDPEFVLAIKRDRRLGKPFETLF